MGANFPITVTAIDKFTGVIRNIKGEAAKVTAPFTAVNKSLKSLGKEVGLEKLGKSFAKVNTFAGDALGTVSKFVGPMAAITGVTTVAGLAALANNWAKFSVGVTQGAISLGMSTDQIQQWRIAGRGLNIDAKTMDGTLSSLGQTIQDAVAGRNQEALVGMSRLGIQLKRTSTGAIDTTDEMLQLADVLHKFEGRPQQQALIAQIFGIDPQTLTLLRQGRAEVQKQLDLAKKSGGVADKTTLANGQAMQNSIVGLQNALQATGNNVGSWSIWRQGADNLTDLLKSWQPNTFKDNPIKREAWQPPKWTYLVNPIGAIIAPILRRAFNEVSAPAPIAKFWQGLVAGQRSAMDTVAGVTHDALSRVDTLWVGEWKFLTGLVGDIKQLFAGLWNSIVGFFRDGVRQANSAMSGMLGLPGQAARGAGSFVGAIGDRIRAAVAGHGIGAPVGAAAVAPGGALGPWGRAEFAGNPNGSPYVNAAGFFSKLVGAPVVITAGAARSGHAPNSEHYTGDAWDFKSPGLTNAQIIARIKASGTPFDELFDEQNHVHVGFRGRRGKLGSGFGTHVQITGHQGFGAPANAAAGHVTVDVNVRHDGHRATVRTRSLGNVQARGRVAGSLNPVPA